MKLGVIGAKLGHTASPAIHEKLFRILQAEGQHQYGVLEMDRSDIPNELQRLRDEGYTGANVTIPYKLDVMPYLTDISREARIIGAVNTLHFTDNGIFGYNTDYSGFGRSLEHAGIGIQKEGLRRPRFRRRCPGHHPVPGRQRCQVDYRRIPPSSLEDGIRRLHEDRRCRYYRLSGL